MTKSHPPSTEKTAFDCPHCGAYASQAWFTISANPIGLNNGRVPRLPNENTRGMILTQKADQQTTTDLLNWVNRLESGLIFITSMPNGLKAHCTVDNIFLSQCFNCQKVAAWVHKTLVFPSVRVGYEPNPDIPDEIARDVEEARSILNLSPRGAAALLRLAIQKLCTFLGEKGKNINDDIGSLVSKGLSPRLQKSLDVVRVIGYEAVHPGVLDLRDDRETALKLLIIVNLNCRADDFAS